jgi:hypothetical protein
MHNTTILVLAIFSLLQSGCSGRSPEKPRLARLTPIYDEAVCTISKTQGRSADLEAASQDSRQNVVAAPFFRKRYSRRYFEAVFSTSAVSTAKFVNKLLGGHLYRVQRDFVKGEKLCPMFTELPIAPEYLYGIWEEQARKTQGGQSRLAALYFQYCDPARDCDDHRLTLPTILIDDARDRWTLVHEMMHFNFDHERKHDIMSIGDNTLERNGNLAKKELYAALELYLKNEDRANLEVVENRASWLIQVFAFQILTRSIFEELATEGLLLEEYLNGKLEHVSPSAARNAIWYMSHSLKLGTERFDEIVYSTSYRTFSMKSMAAFVLGEAKAKNWPEIETKAMTDEKFIEQFLSDTTHLVDQTRLRYEMRTRGWTHTQDSSLAFDSNPVRDLENHLSQMPGFQTYERWKEL